MAFGYPSSTAVFIPNWEDSGNLVVGFSRDPSTFKINQWAAQTPVKRNQGYYLKLNQDMCARMLDATGRLTIWPPGNDSPQFNTSGEQFQFTSFFTQRHADGWSLDRMIYEQAEWDIRSQYNAWTAQRAMTEREYMTIAVAVDTANYDSTHYDTANNWGGGYLDAGTSTNPILKKALQTMFTRIFLDMRGTVRPQDVQVVMNPATAYAISRSQEITDFLKNNVYGLPQVQGGVVGQNANWGLPEKYQDYKIVVDDTVYVDADPVPAGGTIPATGHFAWPVMTVAMFARPGGLVAPAGGASFSTVHVFLKEDMATETMDDVNNRRFTTRITNDWVPQVVAPVTGCLCTSSLSSTPAATEFLDDRPKMKELYAARLAALEAATPGRDQFQDVEAQDAGVPGGQRPAAQPELRTLVERLESMDQRHGRAGPPARRPRRPGRGPPAAEVTDAVRHGAEHPGPCRLPLAPPAGARQQRGGHGRPVPGQHARGLRPVRRRG